MRDPIYEMSESDIKEMYNGYIIFFPIPQYTHFAFALHHTLILEDYNPYTVRLRMHSVAKVHLWKTTIAVIANFQVPSASGWGEAVIYTGGSAQLLCAMTGMGV